MTASSKITLRAVKNEVFATKNTILCQSCVQKLPSGSEKISNPNTEFDIQVSPAPSKRASVSISMDTAMGDELQKLANFLRESNQSVFDFFRAIDLDDSGEIDTMEFQLALKKASIANLPPWDVDELVKQMDMNSDGKLDLPELDLALMRLSPDSGGEEE